jgi:hypothetical protein
LEDPLLAQASAASPLMPLTPPADETMFQPLDASLKLPDTPMADQFAEEYMESVTSEPEVDVESAHLIIHAKVYAIAEKYVPPFVMFCPYLFFRSLACQPSVMCIAAIVVLHCAALRITAEGLRHPAMCVTGRVRVPIQSEQTLVLPATLQHMLSVMPMSCQRPISVFLISIPSRTDRVTVLLFFTLQPLTDICQSFTVLTNITDTALLA